MNYKMLCLLYHELFQTIHRNLSIISLVGGHMVVEIRILQVYVLFWHHHLKASTPHATGSGPGCKVKAIWNLFVSMKCCEPHFGIFLVVLLLSSDLGRTSHLFQHFSKFTWFCIFMCHWHKGNGEDVHSHYLWEISIVQCLNASLISSRSICPWICCTCLGCLITCTWLTNFF